ncbi:vegetative cell wall protein gp1-like, partial [Homarus americanus]|uniref:vegetative cell wall protein gp1-like n=1 Tax=Homarus americanus TaxID=6706 RepID=UPI001C443A86
MHHLHSSSAPLSPDISRSPAPACPPTCFANHSDISRLYAHQHPPTLVPHPALPAVCPTNAHPAHLHSFATIRLLRPTGTTPAPTSQRPDGLLCTSVLMHSTLSCTRHACSLMLRSPTPLSRLIAVACARSASCAPPTLSCARNASCAHQLHCSVALHSCTQRHPALSALLRPSCGPAPAPAPAPRQRLPAPPTGWRYLRLHSPAHTSVICARRHLPASCHCGYRLHPPTSSCNTSRPPAVATPALPILPGWPVNTPIIAHQRHLASCTSASVLLRPPAPSPAVTTAATPSCAHQRPPTPHQRILRPPASSLQQLSRPSCTHQHPPAPSCTRNAACASCAPAPTTLTCARNAHPRPASCQPLAAYATLTTPTNVTPTCPPAPACTSILRTASCDLQPAFTHSCAHQRHSLHPLNALLRPPAPWPAQRTPLRPPALFHARNASYPPAVLLCIFHASCRPPTSSCASTPLHLTAYSPPAPSCAYAHHPCPYHPTNTPPRHQHLPAPVASTPPPAGPYRQLRLLRLASSCTRSALLPYRLAACAPAPSCAPAHSTPHQLPVPALRPSCPPASSPRILRAPASSPRHQRRSCARQLSAACNQLRAPARHRHHPAPRQRQ